MDCINCGSKNFEIKKVRLETTIKEEVLEGVKQTAKKMKLKGIEPKFIAEITELSIEEIEKL